eukprot:4362419-Prorocentrum_lima.AAC.1
MQMVRPLPNSWPESAVMWHAQSERQVPERQEPLVLRRSLVLQTLVDWLPGSRSHAQTGLRILTPGCQERSQPLPPACPRP